MKPSKMKKFLLTLSLSLAVGLTYAQTETTNTSVAAKVDSLQQPLNVLQTKEEKEAKPSMTIRYGLVRNTLRLAMCLKN